MNRPKQNRRTPAPIPVRTLDDAGAPGPIVVAYCHPGQVDGQFHNSVVNVAVSDCMQRRLIGSYMSIESGPRIATTRNKMCRNFLNDHDYATHLLMVDSDMAFSYADVLRLYDTMVDNDIAVCGGLCFSVGQDDGMRSTMLIMPDFDPDDPPAVLSLEPYEKVHGDIPDNALVEVVATGAAFLMIRRDVLEKIRAEGGEDPDAQVHKPWLWFAEAAVGDGELGEDVAFCMRARTQGFNTFVLTALDIPHRKRMQFGLQTWRGAHAIAQPAEATVG